MRQLKCAMLLALLGVIAFILLPDNADHQSEERVSGPPEAPILRLETGRHIAMIGGIATDAQGRWIATASHDKTLRLWDGKKGTLLKTFRPPIGAGNEGKLYAVAMDPAGQWLAAGGWDWDESIYIFDRATGRMRQRLVGLEDVIHHLCTSPDSRWLAAALGDGGVRLYDTHKGFSLRFTDPNYDDSSYGCAFSPDSRSLVTSSRDGQLRRYGLIADGLDASHFRFAKQAQAPAQGGRQPFTVAFHPDGERIAVGFIDTTAVSVVDSHQLTQLYSADTSDISIGNLMNVAWSADGQVLFAGGRYEDDDGSPVLSWSDKGQGLRTSRQAANDTVTDIKALPDNGLLVGTADPALLRYDDQGGTLFDLRTRLVDMRGKSGDNFRINVDGTQLAFALAYDDKGGGKDPVQFDLTDGQLRRSEYQGDALVKASYIQVPGLKIDNWEDTNKPSLNNKPLALKQYEMSRSLAVAPDGQSFLLGTEWRLRLFDRQGNELWQRPVPAIAWGVNISGDNRLAVAAFADGTIRWFRLRDGEPLLSLLITNDAKHWVLWTPSGYYDSSPDGDSLIGWHVNNGKDKAADFHPAAQMRTQFHRPDVVARVLKQLDERKALAEADAELGGTLHSARR